LNRDRYWGAAVGVGVGFTFGRLFFALASLEGAEAGDGLAFGSTGSLAGA